MYSSIPYTLLCSSRTRTLLTTTAETVHTQMWGKHIARSVSPILSFMSFSFLLHFVPANRLISQLVKEVTHIDSQPIWTDICTGTNMQRQNMERTQIYKWLTHWNTQMKSQLQPAGHLALVRDILHSSPNSLRAAESPLLTFFRLHSFHLCSVSLTKPAHKEMHCNMGND